MTITFEESEALASCKRCSEELKHFKAYIPGLGEVCMKCYVEHARELENQESEPRKT